MCVVFIAEYAVMCQDQCYHQLRHAGPDEEERLLGPI